MSITQILGEKAILQGALKGAHLLRIWSTFLSPSNQQNSPPSQGEARNPDNELLKGCLYSLFKFVGLLAAFLLALFLLVDNYKVGSNAFKKGFWESAIFFLENVKTKDEHYKDAQEKLGLAREKLKQEERELTTED